MPDLDDVQGDVVALLRAYQTGDEAAMDALCTDPRLAFAIGQLDTLGALHYGREPWEAACTAWRPGQRLGDDPGTVH